MSDARDTGWFLSRMPPDEVVQSTLRGDPVKRLLGIAADRAIVVVEDTLLPKPGVDREELEKALVLATKAAKRLATEGANAVLTDEEKSALDLYILLISRPAILIQGGRVRERPENWREIERDEELLPEIIAGVGRLESATGDRMGTGFLVADRLILTNNHVVCALTGLQLGDWSQSPAKYAQRCDTANEQWVKEASARPRFEMLGEFGSARSEVVRVKKIAGHHPSVDMAVLELDAMPADAEILPLEATEPQSFPGRRIYAVGYPLQAAANTPNEVLQRVFGSDPASLGTKRFSPGMVMSWHGPNRFDHDASTLGGSSGSAIVDFESRRVVGLHYRGIFKQDNSAIPLFRFRNDPLLADNGIAFV